MLTGFRTVNLHVSTSPCVAFVRSFKCRIVKRRDRATFWILAALFALLPSLCLGSDSDARGPLLFNGTRGVGDCDLDESTSPSVNGTVIHDCVFSAIIRKCSRKKLSDPGLIFRHCRGRICEINLSISATGCVLTSMGLNYTEGLENDKYKCGVPLVNKDLFDVKEITWVDSVPGSRRCALRISPGSRIEQNVICIRGFARLRFTLILGEKLTEGRYLCELNPRCNSYLGIYGESVCFEEANGGANSHRSVAVENGESYVGRFMILGFAEISLWVHGLVAFLSVLFFCF